MAYSNTETVEAYLTELEPDRREAISQIRQTILENVPDGYEEIMLHGMIYYGVPLATFPKTYNGKPLMYAALASQKNHMAVYLTRVYGNEQVAEWFTKRYKATGKKLDMGKSCVRFRKLDDLPLDLIAEVIAGNSVSDFIAIYEAARANAKGRR